MKWFATGCLTSGSFSTAITSISTYRSTTTVTMVMSTKRTTWVVEPRQTQVRSVKVVETTRECLDLAVELVKPGTPIREFGRIVEKHARSRNCDVVTTWGGHGINTKFHPPPWIPHYGKNEAVGVCKAGMTFTIEPILALGSPRAICWPDDWTNVTADGKRTAQFEHSLLVTETGVEVLTARRTESSPGGLAFCRLRVRLQKLFDDWTHLKRKPRGQSQHF
ncbi:peptidase M24, structural domain-containing protein [Aspergillus foveolatus]|uniref:peptidase M24, structural domain-containing protein n=1 Tax=Aspergillus foveolatus TaxID=210207 RepID=UPI003CCC9D9D